MTPDDYVLLDDIERMDNELEALIGRKAFGHIAAPTETSLRISFGDAHVSITMRQAHSHMRYLLATALDDPAKLPWPLCEPV